MKVGPLHFGFAWILSTLTTIVLVRQSHTAGAGSFGAKLLRGDK